MIYTKEVRQPKLRHRHDGPLLICVIFSFALVGNNPGSFVFSTTFDIQHNAGIGTRVDESITVAPSLIVCPANQWKGQKLSVSSFRAQVPHLVALRSYCWSFFSTFKSPRKLVEGWLVVLIRYKAHSFFWSHPTSINVKDYSKEETLVRTNPEWVLCHQYFTERGLFVLQKAIFKAPELYFRPVTEGIMSFRLL